MNEYNVIVCTQLRQNLFANNDVITLRKNCAIVAKITDKIPELLFTNKATKQRESEHGQEMTGIDHREQERDNRLDYRERKTTFCHQPTRGPPASARRSRRQSEHEPSAVQTLLPTDDVDCH